MLYGETGRHPVWVRVGGTANANAPAFTTLRSCKTLGCNAARPLPDRVTGMDRAHGLLHRHPREAGEPTPAGEARGRDPCQVSKGSWPVRGRVHAKLSPCFCSCSSPCGTCQSQRRPGGRPARTHTHHHVGHHFSTRHEVRFRMWPFPSSQAPGEEEQRPCRAAVTHALGLEPTHPTPPEERPVTCHPLSLGDLNRIA